MTSEMELVVAADGVARCIYDEALDLQEIGRLTITRASHVEPDAAGYWWADMGPSGGPVLGPYGSRSEALGAERGWLLGSRACNDKDQRLATKGPSMQTRLYRESAASSGSASSEPPSSLRCSFESSVSIRIIRRARGSLTSR